MIPTSGLRLFSGEQVIIVSWVMVMSMGVCVWGGGGRARSQGGKETDIEY